MGRFGNINLTLGGITSKMLLFAVPLFVGNMLQQCYNIADTVIVGRVVGAQALAAVGSAYALMVFLTSAFFGLSMGSGVLVSNRFGAGDMTGMRRTVYVSTVFVGAVALAVTALSLVCLGWILEVLSVPEDVFKPMEEYLGIVFWGIPLMFVYNHVSSLMRAVGDSFGPLVILAVGIAVNIVLDLVLTLVFGMGIKGVALATVAAQLFSAAGVLLYMRSKLPWVLPRKEDCVCGMRMLGEVSSYSLLTCAQQTVMNFGILLVQGLVNSFGSVVMAAFAAAVKIDSFAYMPLQDFGNAFSTFIAQNAGAAQYGRIRKGVFSASAVVVVFSAVVSVALYVAAPLLMGMFVGDSNPDVISTGVRYLRIEGCFYLGIGILFLLYGYFRAVGKPGISLVLTLVSLGLRVLLAYSFSSQDAWGLDGIWWSVPIGWAAADVLGILLLRRYRTDFR